MTGATRQVRLLLLALALSMAGVGAGGSERSDDACGGIEHLHLPDGQVLCSHGPDDALRPDPGDDYVGGPGDDGNPRANVPSGAVPSEAPQCFGDGSDGRRIQVMAVDVTGGGVGTADDQLRTWAGQVEWTFLASAQRDGARRHVRWVTEADPAGGCRVAIERIVLDAAAVVDLQSTVTALAELGYDRADRKYLLYVDASVGICGVATAPHDDRASADNRADNATGYARVDTDCWTTGDEGFYSVAAHEVAHTLGAVQQSAPNATESRHCTDEWDVMCYVDGPGTVVDTVCQDDNQTTAASGDLYNRLLDCKGDDYFHAGTPRGYLEAHWNVADSNFLSSVPGNGAGYSTRPPVMADPLGRQQSFSGHRGAHRPLLRDAYGWEACDLPITLRVADGDQQGVLSALGVTDAASDVRVAVTDSVAWINEVVGVEVLVVDDEAFDPSDPATTQPEEGILVVSTASTVAAGTTPVPTTVSITFDRARIRSAIVEVDSAVAADRLGVWVGQGIVQALGVGRGGGPADLMAPWPVAEPKTAVAAALLQHLYADGCDVDRRVDDTAAGHGTQRRLEGSRARLDLAAGAAAPADVSVAVARWLRARAGDARSEVVVVCRTDRFESCLGAPALAGADGPIVFVPGSGVPASVAEEVAATIRPDGTAYLLGDARLLSAEVEQQVRDAAGPTVTVTRIAGATPAATAALVADEVLRRRGDTASSADDDATRERRARPTAIVARADQPLDAALVGAFAATYGVPVLLTSTGSLSPETRAWLQAHPGTAVVLGGHGAVSEATLADIRRSAGAAVRVAGNGRFDTAVAIAEDASLWDRSRVRADGSIIALHGQRDRTWLHALAVAPVGAVLRAPVVLVDAGIPPETMRHLVGRPVVGTSPDIVTVTLGAGSLIPATTVEAFHARWLPGFDGNVRLARQQAAD